MRSRPASRIALVGLAGLVLACGGDRTVDVTAPDIDELGFATAASHKPGHNPRGGKEEPIPLIVTFRDDMGDGGDGVKSDGGAYEDGVGGVTAIIAENGHFSLSVKEADTHRKLCFDFTAGTGTTPFDNVGKKGCDDGYFNTRQPEVEGGLRTMAIGSTRMFERGGVFFHMERQWILKFGADCAGNVIEGTKVTITHPEADTWTIENGVGIYENGVTVNAILCKGPIKGKKKEPGGEAWRGAMPFKLTLVQKS